MKKQTVGLCLIARDEEENIKRVIESVEGCVDHIYLTDTGSVDKTIEIAEKTAKRINIPITISKFEWVHDFSKARNFNFEQAQTDWILWLDCDDTLENPENFRQVIQLASLRKATGLFLLYRYKVNSNGQDAVVHNKLRVVRNKVYKWDAPIHENLVLNEDYTEYNLYDDSVKIRHHATDEDFKKSGVRNVRILETLYKEQEGKDLRTVFLLGRELDATGETKRAEELLIPFIESTAINSERLFSCAIICKNRASQGKYQEQLKFAFNGIRIKPNDPLGYTLAAQAYFNLGEYENAINQVKRSLENETDVSDGGIHAPADIARINTMVLVESYLATKQYDLADKTLRYYFDTVATDEEKEEIGTLAAKISQSKKEATILDAFKIIINTNLQTNLRNASKLLDFIPKQLFLRKEYLNAKKALGHKRDHLPNEITIFCGDGYEVWSEETMKTKGLGGSETAVVEIAKRLGVRGFKVTVFNSVKKTATFGNVTYKNYKKINFADKFNYFISWRNPALFEHVENLDAKKKYIWLHDVPNPQQFKNVESIDKIFVLSKHHRQFLPNVAEEKFFYTSNGINVELIEEIEKENIERDANRIIYASSADRGLERLLDVWTEVKKEVPDAKLVWAYGWNTFDAIRSGDPEAMAWKKTMQNKMKELGVEELGRLSKADLIREFFKANIWAYPTEFDEINCIVAQEAQACGCYPITSGHGVLNEVQLTGTKETNLENYKTFLVNALKGAYDSETAYHKKEVVENARKLFSWNRTCSQWVTELFEYPKVNLEPKVSVVCNTIRPGIFKVLKETLQAQTYKNFELIVVDGRYDERKDLVQEYFKDVDFEVLHIGDPIRDKDKFKFGLFHADNAAISVVRGELVVFLQDFIYMPKNGLEKYVNLYITNPNCIYSGVDTRNQVTKLETIQGEKVDRMIDINEGYDVEIKEPEFISPRKWDGKAIRTTQNFYEWELNYASAPRSILQEFGFQLSWDKGFGYDNTEFALRFLFAGGEIIIDETNVATCLSHWQFFGDNDSEGVPLRNKFTNDERFHTYWNYLRTNPSAEVKFGVPKLEFSKEIQHKISKWLKNK